MKTKAITIWMTFCDKILVDEWSTKLNSCMCQTMITVFRLTECDVDWIDVWTVELLKVFEMLDDVNLFNCECQSYIDKQKLKWNVDERLKNQIERNRIKWFANDFLDKIHLIVYESNAIEANFLNAKDTSDRWSTELCDVIERLWQNFHYYRFAKDVFNRIVVINKSIEVCWIDERLRD